MDVLGIDMKKIFISSPIIICFLTLIFCKNLVFQISCIVLMLLFSLFVLAWILYQKHCYKLTPNLLID